MTPAFVTLMLANMLWFGLAFRYFLLKPFAAAAAMVPKPERESPQFRVLAMSIRFLGGMNGALAMLSAGLALAGLLALPVMTDHLALGFLVLVLATAHFSQWWGNVRPYLQERRGEPPPWRIRGAGMYWIFVVDGALAVGNLGLGLMILAQLSP